MNVVLAPRILLVAAASFLVLLLRAVGSKHWKPGVAAVGALALLASAAPLAPVVFAGFPLNLHIGLGLVWFRAFAGVSLLAFCVFRNASEVPSGSVALRRLLSAAGGLLLLSSQLFFWSFNALLASSNSACDGHVAVLIVAIDICLVAAVLACVVLAGLRLKESIDVRIPPDAT